MTSTKYELRRRTNQRGYKQYEIFCDGKSETEHLMTEAQVIERLKTITARNEDEIAEDNRCRERHREGLLLPPDWGDWDNRYAIMAAERREAQALAPGPIDDPWRRFRADE